MKKATLIWLFAFIFILLSGCNQFMEEPVNDKAQPTKMSAPQLPKTNQHIADAAKTILLKRDDVKMVRAVQSKELLVVAVELVHMSTFQSKKLTKEMKKTLEKQFKSKKVEVTTDHKIFIELEKLEEKLYEDDFSKKKLEKEIKKITKLMKEQT